MGTSLTSAVISVLAHFQQQHGDEYVLDEVLGPIVKKELRKRFATVEQKVVRAVSTAVLKHVRGDILGDQTKFEVG